MNILRAADAHIRPGGWPYRTALPFDKFQLEFPAKNAIMEDMDVTAKASTRISIYQHKTEISCFGRNDVHEKQSTANINNHGHRGPSGKFRHGV